LSKVFKIYTNESFKSFLTKIRMEKAIELIMNSELKLYNISEIVGYDDPKYFSKVFKNYFGFSPSRFGEQ
jgi:two-component system response regulator YesN